MIGGADTDDKAPVDRHIVILQGPGKNIDHPSPFKHQIRRDLSSGGFDSLFQCKDGVFIHRLRSFLHFKAETLKRGALSVQLFRVRCSVFRKKGGRFTRECVEPENVLAED